MAGRADPPEPRPGAGAADECRLRVLLVEDDEDDYFLTQDLLAEIPGCRFELEWVPTYEQGLEAVCRLAVPFFADWCAVYVVEDSRRIRQVAAHADPARDQVLRRLGERYPLDRESSSPVARVLKTGRPEVFPEALEALAGSARDA